MSYDISTSETNPAIIAATGIQDSLILDAQRAYTFLHLGVTVSGVTDSNTVFFSTISTVNAEPSYGGRNCKFVLKNGTTMAIGPGINTVLFKTITGTPMIQVIPSENYRGRF